MNTWRKYFTVCCWSFVIISFTVVSGCGYAWRTQKPIHNERSNIDAPVSTMTYPDRVKSEIVYFNHEGTEGELVVTLTREAELFDRKIDTVDRQIYQKSGYGKQHKQWPIWVDAITAPVLAIGGGTALALGASQDTENDVEYRDNPDTGQREQREVPNSSNQDSFYAAGGIGIGLSIPFAISAIHNGVKTKDGNIGAPKRTRITTEIKMRTTTTPLAGTPVEITLPDGTEIAATSDDKGRVVIDLPNNKTAFFPFQYMVQVIVPSKEARYDIPANEKSLALLPPMALARADELAEEVRNAEAKKNEAQRRYDDKVAPYRSRYNSVSQPVPHCSVKGKIKNKTASSLYTHGAADCYVDNHQFMLGTFHKERLFVIENWQDGPTCLTRWPDWVGCDDGPGTLYYRGTRTILVGGAPSEVPVYNPDPPAPTSAEKNALAALGRVQNKWNVALQRAKDRYKMAKQQYNEALPTDPYRLKPVEKKKGQ